MRNPAKVLIANRGEIALRVVRACADSGIKSVAVYSEADRTSLHVREADEAYFIGPSPSAESYLRMDKLVETALECGADAVHPGYGFLAENAEFAEAVIAAGLNWIGPSPESMRLLGDKLAARKLAQAAGVPVVPGTDVSVEDLDQAGRAAESIGYPVLIKASAGGGGKGMRVVNSRSELEDALRLAKSEAKSAFGSDIVYLEKYLESVRHVEIAFFGDQHGNYIYFVERECSIQRRHQKLIEESPSPAVNDDIRRRMGEVAVAAARAANYSGAGTVEFLLDSDKNFYFLEVNARLQVEHPVTELVSGVDAVLEQFRIASGQTLSVSQEELGWRGHAIECRIAAEDPFNNFAPSLGTVRTLLEPSGPGVRVDSSLYQGAKVSIYYDPMVAKLIVWGHDRDNAILRMKRALEEYRITGIQTNIPFHIGVMSSRDFQQGLLDTRFIDRHLTVALQPGSEYGEHELVAAIVAALVTDRRLESGSQATDGGTNGKPQRIASNWKVAGWKAGMH